MGNNKQGKGWPERDELRARFTVWLETLVYRARTKYLRKMEGQVKLIPVEELPEEMLEWQEPEFLEVSMDKKDFDFEEEKLARAFSELPLMKKEILRLLFVEEKSPAEIARQLNCSVQHVYNQRSEAVRKMRETLEKKSNDT